jgi:hypothetical protein
MKNISKPLIILFSALIFIGASCWLNRFTLAKYYHMNTYFKASPTKLIKKHEKEFLEDREVLAQYELFTPSSGEKDAGPFLNPKIRWEIGDIAHKGSLTLPEFIHKELNKDWVLKKPLFKKMGLNFQWMKDLHEFDVWNPEENSPAFESGKKYETYSFPIPSYKDLITWAKLRYLYGKETGDVQSALKDVRHLMRLIFTNDYHVSSIVVVNMLQMENQFEEILTPKEMGDWKFIPQDHVMRARRYFHALPSVADIRLSDEIFEKMTKTNTGLCPMLFEGMMNYLSIRDLLQDELKYGFNRMDRMIKSANCRKTILHKMWEDPKWRAAKYDFSEIEILGEKVTRKKFAKHPGLKEATGFIYANSITSAPNFAY